MTFSVSIPLSLKSLLFLDRHWCPIPTWVTLFSICNFLFYFSYCILIDTESLKISESTEWMKSTIKVQCTMTWPQYLYSFQYFVFHQHLLMPLPLIIINMASCPNVLTNIMTENQDIWGENDSPIIEFVSSSIKIPNLRPSPHKLQRNFFLLFSEDDWEGLKLRTNCKWIINTYNQQRDIWLALCPL